MIKIPTNLSDYNQIKITPVKIELNVKLEGEKEYKLIINKNGIIRDSIQSFIKNNSLASNYYSFIKSSVGEVIKFELNQKVASTQEGWSKNFENLNEDDIDNLINSTILDFKNNLKLDNLPNKERFDIIYQTLITISSPQVFNKLLELDLTYINEVRKLDENWKNQFLLITEDHEQELSNYKLQFNNNDNNQNYQSILSKHKQDIEMIQLSWMSDLNELKSKQIRENSELIKLLHDALTSTKDVSLDFSSHLGIMKNLVETEFLTRPNCSQSLQNLFKEVAELSPKTNKLGITVSGPISGLPNTRIQDYINQLQSMGFTEQQAENALSITGYDFEEAVDLLLENPEKVPQQQAPPQNPSSSTMPSKFSLSKLASSSPPIFKNWGFKPFQSNESGPAPSSNLQNNQSSGGTSNKLRDWIGKTVSDIWTESNDARRGTNNLNNNPNHQLSESFTILLGNQIRIPFNLVLKVSDLNELVPQPSVDDIKSEIGIRTQTLASLYTNELRGLVVAINPKQLNIYQRGNDVNRVLFDYCRHTTEFHFNDYNYQLKEVYDNINSKGDGNGFKEGDYFITKHSNLPLYHTVFHLIVDFQKGLIKDDFNQKSSLYASLKNILVTCYQHDIMDLTFPLGINLPPTNQKSLEIFFKCLKGLLIDTARWPNFPLPDPHQFGPNTKTVQNQRTLQLVLPKNTSFDEFVMVRDLLTSVFKTF